MMKTRRWLYVVVSLALVSGAGCAPPLTPVNGNTLYHDAYPNISVSAKAPLQLLDAGKEWSSLQSDSLTLQPLASFTYALYSATTQGPVTVHAHALIVQPTDINRWLFLLDNYKLLNSLHYSEIARGGHGWNVQLLRVPSEQDWASGMWQANQRSVPEVWLAKRFFATPDKATRVVAEYREPWPSCLKLEAPDLTGTPAECLAGFLQRADAAFSLNETPIPAAPGNPPKLPNKSAIAPDLAAMAGKVEMERTGSSDHSP